MGQGIPSFQDFSPGKQEILWPALQLQIYFIHYYLQSIFIFSYVSYKEYHTDNYTIPIILKV